MVVAGGESHASELLETFGYRHAPSRSCIGQPPRGMATWSGPVRGCWQLRSLRHRHRQERLEPLRSWRACHAGRLVRGPGLVWPRVPRECCTRFAPGTRGGFPVSGRALAAGPAAEIYAPCSRGRNRESRLNSDSRDVSSLVCAGSSHDIESCVDLWTRLIAARDGLTAVVEVAERARTAFEQPIVRFAVVGSAPVGFALTITRQQSIALLSRICVDPSVTSRGHGAALVADAVGHARNAGMKRIDLDVREKNTRAIALYARAEFVAISAPWKYDDGDRVVTYSRDLTIVERPIRTGT